MLAEVQHQTRGTRLLRKFVDGALESPLLLLGPEGIGRRFSVEQAAQELFCEGTKQAGCPCSSCYMISRGNHPDVITLAPVGEKVIGINDVREILSEARSYPAAASLRCFILDGADRLSIAAANALLKTLEDPPARSRFFLLAEDRDRVLPTIRSRCGVVRYGLLPEAFVVSVVSVHATDDAKALVYARMGEGSVGRAIRYLGGGKLALRDQCLQVLHYAVERDLPAFFSAVDAMDSDLPLTLKLLSQLLHDVLIVRLDPMRAVHTDRLEDLQGLGQEAGLEVWATLAGKVQVLHNLRRVTSINLPFHLKTALVETFAS